MTDRIREALEQLVQDATVVQRYGAQTGSQWTKLGIALIRARQALAEPRLALPPIPVDDGDFTPDLARKIIARYQQLLSEPCVLNPFSSRACQRGTKTCVVDHGEEHG
jgi:hypothetical protein